MPIEPIYYIFPPSPSLSYVYSSIPEHTFVSPNFNRHNNNKLQAQYNSGPQTASGDGNNKLTCFIYGANVNEQQQQRNDKATQRQSDKATPRVAVKIVLICCA